MNSDYKKSSIWKLVIVYLVIGVLIYGIVYYVVKANSGNKSGLYGASPEQNSVTPQTIPSSDQQPTTPSQIDNSVITTRTDPAKGQFLTSIDGKTLYTFDNDTTGVSNCTGACLSLWPPYLAPSSITSTLPMNISSIMRDDGTAQYAYKGKALYTYSKDLVPGDINGDGFNGIWHIINVM